MASPALSWASVPQELVEAVLFAVRVVLSPVRRCGGFGLALALGALSFGAFVAACVRRAVFPVALPCAFGAGSSASASFVCGTVGIGLAFGFALVWDALIDLSLPKLMVLAHFCQGL